MDPYTKNTAPVTPNSGDVILAPEEEDADPFMHYAHLGDCVEDGILAWFRVGVNMSYDRNVNGVTTMFEDGGQMNEDAPLECFAGGFPPIPTGTEKPQGLSQLSGGFAVPSRSCEASGYSSSGNSGSKDKGKGDSKGKDSGKGRTAEKTRSEGEKGEQVKTHAHEAWVEAGWYRGANFSYIPLLGGVY